MDLFRVQTVNESSVSLVSVSGAALSLPLSCFEQPPTVGQDIRLLALPAIGGQALPHSLARSLLNELLNPSTP